jgi:putative transposase
MDDNDKYKNKYRISSARLQGYDYSANGFYFVTICTNQRAHHFGEVVYGIPPEGTSPCGSRPEERPRDPKGNHAHLQPTPIAQIADDYWNKIPVHYPFVELDEYVIMPNHIHGILFFNKPDKTDWVPNKFGTQSKNLGAVIRGFKSTVKSYANDNQIDFSWQPRFHDEIIKDERALHNIRRYLIHNPDKWIEDEFN